MIGVPRKGDDRTRGGPKKDGGLVIMKERISVDVRGK